MTNHFLKKLPRKLWTRAFGESSWIEYFGDFRAREKSGLIARPNYRSRAADVAKFCGKQMVAIVEFGVATNSIAWQHSLRS
jgi:hypothetical protein